LATPKQLVEVIANIFNVSEATVTVHDRNLSVAGLRTMAGRGRAAAQVTSRDAANLMVAVAASRNVKDSVYTVEQFGGLQSKRNWDSYLLNPPEMKGLGKNHTVVEAIAALIESAMNGTLEECVEQTIGAPADLRNSDALFSVRVTFKGASHVALLATIAVETEDDRETDVHFYDRTTSIVKGKKLTQPPMPGVPAKLGLFNEAYFDLWSIMNVADLLKVKS
jgi:hypothetical protein